MKTKSIMFLLALLCGAFLSAAGAEATIPVNKAAKLDVTVQGEPPFSYKWQKALPGQPNNFADIPGAPDAPTYTTPKFTQSGTEYFRVIVSNAGGSVTSDTATATISPEPPRIISFGITIVDAP